MPSSPPESLLGTAKSLLRPTLVRGAVASTRLARRLRRRPPPTSADPTLAIVGLLETASGLGVAARSLHRTLADRSPQLVSLSELSRTPRLPAAGPVVLTPRSPGACRTDIALHVYNPDIFLAAVRRFGTGFLAASRVNVALPIWETETLPPQWANILSLYDVICSHSRFATRAFEKGTGRPVAVIPNSVPEQPVRIRGTGDGPLVFLAMFDHRSCFDRKNPLSAVHAFRRATTSLPPGSARLRIKCHSGTPDAVIDLLRSEAGAAPIEIIARTLDEAGIEHLWQECDCLVSLHRSEGFGLPVAEALSRAIPVIASRQGGILDFTDDRGCLLVSGKPAVPPRDRGQYAEWTGWLEPDVAEAAAHIVAVVNDYDRAARLALAGRTMVAETLSTRSIRDRLDDALQGL